jgi:hypothetical protein
LIVTATDVAERLLPTVHNLENLTDIYIVDSSVTNVNRAKLTKKYTKLKGCILLLLDDKEMHICTLSLCGDNDNQLRDVFTSMKDEIGQETNLLSLANILQEMGEFHRTAHFYYSLLAKLPANSFNVAVCYYSLSSIAYARVFIVH